MLTVEHYIAIVKKIEEEKKPLKVKTPFGVFLFVLSKEASIYYQKKGYPCITVEKFFNEVLKGETEEEQKQIAETIIKILIKFRGRMG